VGFSSGAAAPGDSFARTPIGLPSTGHDHTAPARWIADLGYEAPDEEQLHIGVRFLQRTKRPVDEAWMMSTGADLGHTDVVGPRPARWRLINAYLNRLLRVAHRDPVVAKTFLEGAGWWHDLST
jgi:hypothetical protein